MCSLTFSKCPFKCLVFFVLTISVCSCSGLSESVLHEANMLPADSPHDKILPSLTSAPSVDNTIENTDSEEQLSTDQMPATSDPEPTSVAEMSEISADKAQTPETPASDIVDRKQISQDSLQALLDPIETLFYQSEISADVPEAAKPAEASVVLAETSEASVVLAETSEASVVLAETSEASVVLAETSEASVVLAEASAISASEASVVLAEASAISASEASVVLAETSEASVVLAETSDPIEQFLLQIEEEASGQPVLAVAEAPMETDECECDEQHEHDETSRPVIVKDSEENTLTDDFDQEFYARYSKKFGIEFNGSENKELLMAVAKWFGVPHKMGGCSKYGVDCSCFVKNIYKNVYGVALNRTSSNIFYKDSMPVKKRDLQEGDIICFKIRGRRISHIGIYIKDDKFVHASSSKGVRVSDLKQKYFRRRFFSGGRILDMGETASTSKTGTK